MDTEKKTKVCKSCGRELPLESFAKCAKNADGLQGNCRQCQSEANKQSYQRRKDMFKQLRADNPLSAYTPRELMAELKARGYEGKLTYTYTIEL